MAFPRADRQYALITDAATGTADTPGGLGAILTQKDQFDNYYAISYASRQLKAAPPALSAVHQVPGTVSTLPQPVLFFYLIFFSGAMWEISLS